MKNYKFKVNVRRTSHRCVTVDVTVSAEDLRTAELLAERDAMAQACDIDFNQFAEAEAIYMPELQEVEVVE